MIYLAFLDFRKAFELLERNPMQKALKAHEIHAKYQIERGVKQGDPLCPALSSDAL